MYFTFEVTTKSGLNVLGILVFSIAFGIVLGGMGEAGKPLKDFFNCLSEVSMKIVHLIIWYDVMSVLVVKSGQLDINIFLYVSLIA